MALDDFIDVNFQLSADPVSRVGFGTLAVLLPTEAGDPVYDRSYASIQELEEDISEYTSDEYAALSAAFTQGSGFSRLRVLNVGWGGSGTDEEKMAAIFARLDQGEYYSVVPYVDGPEGDTFFPAFAAAIMARKTIGWVIGDWQDMLGLGYNRVFSAPQNTDPGNGYDKMKATIAWNGRMLPEDPGTENWAYKTLAGVRALPMTSTQRRQYEDDLQNYYTTEHGVSFTFPGISADPGWYVDLVRGLDWLTIRLQERYLARQIQGPGIKYLEGGSAVIEQIVRAQMDEAVERGIIAADYRVFVPEGRDQDPNDRARRYFPGVIIECELLGFINTLKIRGTAFV